MQRRAWLSVSYERHCHDALYLDVCIAEADGDIAFITKALGITLNARPAA